MTETTFAARLSAPPDDVGSVHALLDSVWSAKPDLPADDRMRFETALIELMANVIGHSGPGPVQCELTITVAPDRLVAIVTDSGAEVLIDLDAPPPVVDELAESGRGIALIRALVDEFEYQRTGDRNRWLIARRLS